jgi:hypothetical protein
VSHKERAPTAGLGCGCALPAAYSNARSDELNRFQVNKFVYEVNLTTVLLLVHRKTVRIVLFKTELADLSELIFRRSLNAPWFQRVRTNPAICTFTG